MFGFFNNYCAEKSNAVPISCTEVDSCCCLLFNGGHVLQLRSETVAVRRQEFIVWMIYVCRMITGDEYGPNFLTFVLRLRENPG